MNKEDRDTISRLTYEAKHFREIARENRLEARRLKSAPMGKIEVIRLQANTNYWVHEAQKRDNEKRKIHELHKKQEIS